MTQISSDDVVKLATMSSLQLADDEIAQLGTDITNIFGYIEQLNELDTEGVGPTYQVNHLSNVWREDDVAESLTGDTLVSLAADAVDQQIKVPKVL
jgi:aspartyl-tRNA(Asn)/glutamyl-tRNA(Gln) amidotransferase subunit C